MQRTKTASGIVIGTIAMTLAAIVAAVGLVFAITVSVRPDYAYGIYEYLGNARGKYVYAVKMYDEAREANAPDAEVAAALGRVINDGLAYRAEGGEPEGLAEYVATMLARPDVAQYGAAVDARSVKSLAPLYHVFSTGYEGMLAGEYVALCYAEQAEKTLFFATERWEAFVRSTEGELADVRADAALDVFVAAYAKAPVGAMAQMLELEYNGFLTSFDPGTEIASRCEAVDGTSKDELFGALHLAKSVTKLAEAFELIGYENKAFTTFWETQFARLLTAYVAAA